MTGILIIVWAFGVLCGALLAHFVVATTRPEKED